MNFSTVTINTKFLNSLQPEWLKYVTQVCLAKQLIVDSFDDLFDYLQQFEKLVNASRAKKLEKSHDPLALVENTSSSSRQTSSYYVTHPTSVVDYDDEYQQDDTNNRLRASSNTKNQAIIQGDRVDIQSRNSGNTKINNRQAYVQEEVVEGMKVPKEPGNVQRTLRTLSSGNTLTVQCYNCSEKGHYARNCPKPRVCDSKYFMWNKCAAKQMKLAIQPADNTSDDGPSCESAFISELEKLENENVSLDFKVQSLIKERDNVKIEYQKLFDSIKKTRSQTQKEMDELIIHVSEKTYAYGVIRAENQDLFCSYHY
ncbi:zinc finger, CCHC-type containing protein [Tanacetum coccineum]